MREEKVWAPPLHFHGIQIQFKLCKFYSLENRNLPRSFYSHFLRCILIFKNHFSRWSLIIPRLLTSCWSPTQRWRLTMTMTNIPSDLEETPPIKCLHCLHCCHCVHYFHYFNCLHWLHSGICAYIHCYMVRALAHNGLWDLFGVGAGWMGWDGIIALRLLRLLEHLRC